MNKFTQDAKPVTGDDIFNVVSIGPIDPEIVRMEADLRAAQLGGDIGALSVLISDDVLFAGPDGSLATKSMDIDAHRSGLVRFLQHKPHELHVRRLTDQLAVVSLAAELSVEVGGHVTTGMFRYIRVWHCDEDGRWQVRAGQVGLIGTPS